MDESCFWRASMDQHADIDAYKFSFAKVGIGVYG